jgi:hypothetical protein
MRCHTASKALLEVPTYSSSGPERYVEMCRAELRRRRDAPVAIRASLVFALVFAGSG